MRLRRRQVAIERDGSVVVPVEDERAFIEGLFIVFEIVEVFGKQIFHLKSESTDGGDRVAGSAGHGAIEIGLGHSRSFL